MPLSRAAYAPYRNPEEYILEWTDRIWEANGLGLIRDHYASDVILHGAYGTMRDVESVIRGSLMKKFAFPHRSFTGEDVIWEERGGNAFVSSHRTLNVGVQDGFWQYGPPGHRQSVSRNIALCLVRDALVVEEWVARDEYAVVEQSGLDVAAVAETLAAEGNAQVLGRGGGPTASEPLENPLTVGDSGERPDHHREECLRILGLIEEVWNQRLFDRLPDYLDRDVVCHTSRDRVATRIPGYLATLGDLLAAFPDAYVQVRDVAANSDPFRGLRVAVMWRLVGSYCGVPRYGAPTGGPIEILGHSHFHLRGDRVYREWRIYDEVAVMSQIARHRGTAAAEPDAGGGAV